MRKKLLINSRSLGLVLCVCRQPDQHIRHRQRRRTMSGVCKAVCFTMSHHCALMLSHFLSNPCCRISSTHFQFLYKHTMYPVRPQVYMRDFWLYYIFDLPIQSLSLIKISTQHNRTQPHSTCCTHNLIRLRTQQAPSPRKFKR